MRLAIAPEPGRSRWHAVAVAITLLFLTTTSVAAIEPDGERKDELIHLLQHDCGSCHGMTLKGGLGPSLLPEQLEDKSAMMLRATILIGRAGTPMPPWQGILSEEEVDWLVGRLQEGISDAH
ncbi:c-type cytochrome [Thiohalomonas denitrificans]|uniref:Cytochrome c55X n=1 Tax=Thiohalomonas denitrificans TaxID=415747 RepID=A0A1G5Q944_9GAMM|nr:cytochrome c [Thiohalomonas denitrificans]SCZ58197.1 cytochrome c55X [Thiohalomonas denitrificans]